MEKLEHYYGQHHFIPNNEKYLFSWNRDDYCALAVDLAPAKKIVFAAPCFDDQAYGICEIQKVPE